MGSLLARTEAMARPGALRARSRGAELVANGHGHNLPYYTHPGIDTVANSLASAIAMFAEHPDQWDLVRDDPSLIPSAYHEVLRLHPPIQYFTRRAATATEIGGVGVPAGSRVLLMFGSANRDERHYPDPDRFDVTRNPTDHLAFGRGVHRCVGATLADVEAHAMLTALARRVRRFECHGAPQWRLNNVLHGLDSLVVSAITEE